VVIFSPLMVCGLNLSGRSRVVVDMEAGILPLQEGRAMLTDASANSVDEFAGFFESQRRAALQLAYVLCGNSSDAEDVVAESFARMYPAWASGRVDEPAGYLRRIIVNQVRRGWRHTDVQRRYDPQLRTMTSHTAPGADAEVTARDAVRVAMASLPPKQRAVVALRYLEDLSEAETAALLDVSIGTVKAHASRGLERLREVLAAQNEGPKS
jgi:RNA polymerase sigma-70 factor (sigma-E family)